MALILDNFARCHRLAHIDTAQKERWQKDLKVPYSVFQVPEFRIPEVAWNQKVNLRAAQIQIVETA